MSLFRKVADDVVSLPGGGRRCWGRCLRVPPKAVKCLFSMLKGGEVAWDVVESKAPSWN